MEGVPEVVQGQDNGLCMDSPSFPSLALPDFVKFIVLGALIKGTTGLFVFL